jgi:hypothetical protein
MRHVPLRVARLMAGIDFVYPKGSFSSLVGSGRRTVLRILLYDFKLMFRKCTMKRLASGRL